MSSTEPTTHASLEQILASLRRRQRQLNMIRHAGHGLLAGSLATIGVAVGAWWADVSWSASLPLICAVLIVAGAVLGGLVGALMPIADLRLARSLDRAAASEDRFASALQLLGHSHRERARLVADDALARVQGTAVHSALPMQMPRSAKWSVMPVAILTALLLLLPETTIEAAPEAPEIAAEDWARLHDEFRKELESLDTPESPDEEEMRKMLEKLASLLAQNPEKKDVLKEIAKLSEEVERRRKEMGPQDFSMKNAANALARSEALKQFASMLKQGEYDKAAMELDSLAQEMEAGEKAPDASEFESIASDMERLAEQLASQQEMQSACEKCANAASKMNRESLAEAMKRLSEQLKKNCQNMKQCDRCSRCSSILDELKRRMNQCSGCKGNKPGDGMCQNPGANKGGEKPGWGSAAKWDGGALAQNDETREADLADVAENNGENSSYTMVSPDERARSAIAYEDLYAEFVQKTEADLNLDNVPVAYREFLRRYFNSIRPQEAATSDEGEASN
jgi:hypothetical protein